MTAETQHRLTPAPPPGEYIDSPRFQIGAKKGLANYGPSGFAGNLPQDIGWQK